MKYIYILSLKCLLVCSLGLLTTSCEDGDPGVAGADGINGTNGADGANGANGENGVGYDELTKYGSATLTLKGKRNDNVDFDKNIVLKYSKNNTSYYEIQGEGTPTTTHSFTVQRNMYGKQSQSNYVQIYLYVKDLGKETQEFINPRIRFWSVPIVNDDLTFYELDDDYIDGNPGVSNYKITDFAFNETTKKLTYKLSLDVDAANNRTGNPLSISGTVDVTVPKRIYDPS